MKDLVKNPSSLGVDNPCEICKFERWSLNSPLVCIYVYLLCNNHITISNLKILVGGGTEFDCLSFLCWTQLQKQISSLHNQAPIFFTNTFSLKTSYRLHLLKMLTKSCSYLLRKYFKSKNSFWSWYFVDFLSWTQFQIKTCSMCIESLKNSWGHRPSS